MKLVSDVEVLYFGAAAARGPRKLIVYPERRGDPTEVPYDVLLDRARGAADGLLATGDVREGEPFLLLAGNDLDTVVAFLGGILGGALPVPISPPQGLGGLDAWLDRLEGVAQKLGATAIAGAGAFLELTRGTLPTIDTSALPASGRGHPRVRAGVSHVQLTSGSTADAKGVLITHSNLEANIRGIGTRSDITEDDCVVSWLPLYHDMGLVGALLFSLHWNVDLALLSPVTFLTRPASWFEAIDRHRGSLSPAPSFAYPYVAHRLRNETLDLDLSTWRVAYCGAEPIQHAAVQRFVDLLAPCKLNPGVLLPCYGLAEATLAVTFVPAGRGLVTRDVSRAALARGQVRAPDGLADVETLVLLGTALPKIEVQLRDASGMPSAPDTVGGLWLRGETVTPGYYRDEVATAETRDEDGWLSTGDLGCWIDGELALIGRSKDVIIVRGSNHTPVSLEWAAEAVDGVRAGSSVAFAAPDAGTEGAVVACEVAESESDWSRGAIARQIEDAITKRVGLRPLDVVLLGPGGIPKTTSGKVRRAHTRELYLQGRLS